MKARLFTLLLLTFAYVGHAQLLMKPAGKDDPKLPHWVKLMYAPNPNVYLVEREYQKYSASHPMEQNPHTAYYNHWRKYIQPYIMEDGSVNIPSATERINQKNNRKKFSGQVSEKNNVAWNFVGPEKNFRIRYAATDSVKQISWHANTYCIDQSMSNPDVLFAGGENGGIYKTTDKGLQWQYVSLNEDITTVSSIAIDPFDENIVIANADEISYKTTDGGQTWSLLGTPNPQLQNINIWQFHFNPVDPQIIFAGGEDSLYRSSDGGNTWTGVFGGACQSVEFQPGNPTIVFALRYDAVSKIAGFYKSVDGGLTFSHKPTGWFTVPVVDQGLIESYGGRIAVTEADTNRVYVLLVGQSQSTAQLQLNGFIGVYRSDDGGETWSNPHGLIGAPYTVPAHPNLMNFGGDNNTYNQIYYNTALVVSQLDADRIIIGGLSMWRSDDAGITFQAVGGYVGSVPFIHPDNQEFKIYKTSPTTEELWWACDGGINYSTDFVTTHESRAAGLYGSAFWGFDQGWNDDILVGGRYHNGNAGKRDGYPPGEFQQLGGGEAASGYVNYSNEKKTYFSDIEGIILPDTLNGLAKSFQVNNEPNESYVDNSSSRIIFDWDFWNVAYLGKENKIYKSINGGSDYGVLFSFGNTTGDKILWIEQSRANTNVIYAQQVINNSSVIWKTTDRGVTWNQILLPQSKRELNFTLSYNSANELWISYPKGANGFKIYHSTTGGLSWTNKTTALLNGLEIEAMAHQFGTDGGVYIGTYHGPVFYRNNNMSDWNIVGTNLPYISYPLRLVPFYRDNKIRLATWHLGIWETQLFEPSAVVADFSANFQQLYCPGDSVSFVPHAVASSTATYQWFFTGANPATSTQMYPKVQYTAAGNFPVKLIVTDGSLSDSIIKNNFITSTVPGIVPFQEDFEDGIFSNDWKLKGTDSTASLWSVENNAGGFGASDFSLQFDNYRYQINGAHDAVWTPKYDFTNVVNARLKFDVAYVPYDNNYSDTLEILISTDCGVTFSSVYLNGGAGIATGPSLSSGPFVPLASQWRTDSIDVSAFAGNQEVFFAFVNIGHFGQVLYMDNINLEATITSVSDPENNFVFTLYPDPAVNEIQLESSNFGSNCRVNIIDLQGKAIKKFVFDNPGSKMNMPVADLNPGIYLIEVKNNNKSALARFVKVK